MAGLPVRALNLLLAVTTAVTVTVAMRAVGLLLVSALMVVPVATAQLVTRGFRTTMHLAMLLGVAAAGGGHLRSPPRTTPRPGATIVLGGDRRIFAVDRRGCSTLARGAAAAPGRNRPPWTQPPDVVLEPADYG